MSIVLAAFLMLLGAGTRLVPHPPNFVPMGAISLYAGARLPRRWAFAVPLGAMLLSDIVLDWGHGRPFFTTWRVASYIAFTLLVGLGWLARDRNGVLERAG